MTLTEIVQWREWLANGGAQELEARTQALSAQVVSLRDTDARLAQELAEQTRAYEAQIATLEATNAALRRHIDTLRR